MITSFLTFSDSAKYATIAKNIVLGNGVVANHSFFDTKLLTLATNATNFPASIYSLNVLILSFIFRYLPINDTTVSLVGLSFFFLSALLIFLITNRLHNKISALFATSLFLINRHFIEYSINFSTEILFIFLILLFTYFLILDNKMKLLAVPPLLLSFLVKPQAVLLFSSTILAIFPTALKYFKKSPHKVAITVGLLGILFLTYQIAAPRFYLIPFAGGLFGTLHISPEISQGAYLRGASYIPMSNLQVFSKIFYNLYNFIKNLTEIASPALFILYLLALTDKDKKTQTIKSLSTWLVITFFIATSISLPAVRYIHPIVPLLQILASVQLVKLASRLNRIKSIFLILTTFLLLATADIGHLTLDARYLAKHTNTTKPPITKVVSNTIAQHVPKGKLIITNLDAWPAWYEGLTTMWFPLSPKALEGYQHKVDYIVMTNYQENDADFTLGEWAEVVYKPKNINNEFLKKNYKLLVTFDIPPLEVYENQPVKGTILIRR